MGAEVVHLGQVAGSPVLAGAVLPPAGGALGPVRSLYIHTPFCSHKCHYCDFYSFVEQDGGAMQGVFVDRLLRELAALSPWARGAPLRTVFIGGGTPSLLRLDLWERLLAGVRDLFDLSLIDQARSHGAGPGGAARDEWGSAEFTVECNPESTSGELMRLLSGGGVTRVSMGAQSFVARHLSMLERTHDPANVERGLAAAAEAGIARRSIDLIYAIPGRAEGEGQTLAEWGSDVERALALGTTHLSCYNLVYEPGTVLAGRLRRGEFVPVDEDLEADMFELAADRLGAKGLERYEVSNYAVPGEESRHNLAYWLGEQWLAAGPSASGNVGGVRTKNVGNIRMYLEGGGDGTSPLSDWEGPDPARAVRERLMTGVRLARGVDGAEVRAAAEAANPGSGDRLTRKAAELAGDGLLRLDGRWRVTDGRAWLMADWIAKQLMAQVGERQS